MKLAIALILASLMAACATPSLPDPSAPYPEPPAVLMEPGQNLQTIPTGE